MGFLQLYLFLLLITLSCFWSSSSIQCRAEYWLSGYYRTEKTVKSWWEDIFAVNQLLHVKHFCQRRNFLFPLPGKKTGIKFSCCRSSGLICPDLLKRENWLLCDQSTHVLSSSIIKQLCIHVSKCLSVISFVDWGTIGHNHANKINTKLVGFSLRNYKPIESERAIEARCGFCFCFFKGNTNYLWLKFSRTSCHVYHIRQTLTLAITRKFVFLLFF